MTELICIGCPRGCHLKVDEENGYKVTGNSCPIGAEYGANELRNPTRVLTSTVKIKGGLHDCLPVKTNKPIPKGLLIEAMGQLRNIEVSAPVKTGDVIVENLLNTGADVIATRNM
ncbi:MAG: DUF1667 domain-containing protein [Erysipelotrichaceae bacterium]|jgi:CxxC motif-containing protein|nr:DUF1667 domain-containing protein [Erysipelotrichaceae bacterium]